jgi:predicted HTH domain antitoxin
MPLHVTLDLPPDIEARLRLEHSDFTIEVKEAYALELFRRGDLSHYELSRVLGLDHLETDAWLKRREVYEGSLTMADLNRDLETLDGLMSKARE